MVLASHAHLPLAGHLMARAASRSVESSKLACWAENEGSSASKRGVVLPSAQMLLHASDCFLARYCWPQLDRIATNNHFQGRRSARPAQAENGLCRSASFPHEACEHALRCDGGLEERVKGQSPNLLHTLCHADAIRGYDEIVELDITPAVRELAADWQADGFTAVRLAAIAPSPMVGDRLAKHSRASAGARRWRQIKCLTGRSTGAMPQVWMSTSPRTASLTTCSVMACRSRPLSLVQRSSNEASPASMRRTTPSSMRRRSAICRSRCSRRTSSMPRDCAIAAATSSPSAPASWVIRITVMGNLSCSFALWG